MKPIAKTVHIGKANLIRLASQVIDKAFELTVYRHTGKKGKFKQYSEGYQKKKSISGQGGIAGQPDLYASGKMMNSLLIRKSEANDDIIPVGWINPKSEQKLEWNASDRGKNRIVSDDSGDFPFAKSIGDWFYNEVDKILNKKVKDTDETIHIKLNM